jgi:hypothetical protein
MLDLLGPGRWQGHRSPSPLLGLLGLLGLLSLLGLLGLLDLLS